MIHAERLTSTEKPKAARHLSFMLRALYDWTLSLAARKTAEVWLAVIAFVESSIFLIPADVLFLPMALAKPTRAYRYAAVATIASTLGGIAGYMIGWPDGDGPSQLSPLWGTSR